MDFANFRKERFCFYPSRLSEYLVGKDQARSKTHQSSKVSGVEDGLAEHRKASRIEGDFEGVSAAAEEAAVKAGRHQRQGDTRYRPDQSNQKSV